MRKLLLQTLVSGLFLGYVAYSVDWRRIVDTFYHLNVAYFGLSTSVAILGPVVVAAKYRILIARTALDTPFAKLVTINFIARFYSLFLPSAAGPEAVRWYKLTKNRSGKTSFLAITVFERMLFVFVVFLCGAIPVFLSDQQSVEGLAKQLLPWIITIGLGLTLGLTYFLWPGFRDAVVTMVFRVLQLSKQSRVGVFIRGFNLPRISLRIFVAAIGFACIWQVLFVVRMFLLFESNALPFSLWNIAWIASTVLLLQSLPLSVAGLGVREGAYASLFSLFEVPAEAGVVVGLLFFVQMLVVSALGWALELIDNGRTLDTNQEY